MGADVPGYCVFGEGAAAIAAPRRLQTPVGVVVAVTGQADLAGVLKSLASQEVAGPVELVVAGPPGFGLSGADLDNATAMIGNASVKFVMAPAAHSQAALYNYGASHATSPTLVFLPAGARLDHPMALEILAAWAHAEGVGAITCASLHDRVPKAASHAEVPIAVRELDLAERMPCSAMSRTAWRLVGEFDDIRFPNLFDQEWARRATRLGLQNLSLGLIGVFVPDRPSIGRPSERLLLRSAGAVTGSHEAGPDGDEADRSDRRAEFLAAELLAARRSSLVRQQDLVAELGHLTMLAEDLRRAVEVLSFKLERG